MNILSNFRFCSKLAGYFVFIIGLAALIGWIFNIPILESGLPGLVAMKVNTAISFILIGLSLTLLQSKIFKGNGAVIARLCAIPVIVISFLTLMEFVFGVKIGIDQMFIPEMPGAVLTVHLGRMAIITAIEFFLVGLLLLVLDNKTLRGHYLSQSLAFMAWLGSLGSIIGYFYGASEFYGSLGAFTPIALPTAIAFFAASSGILLYMSDSGIMNLFADEGVAGFVLRRLWPFTIVIPLILGWLEYFGEYLGIFSKAFGLSLAAVVNIFFFSIIIIRNAKSTKQIETARMAAKDVIVEQNLKLLELSQLKSDFISMISHELRTPLTIVRESVSQFYDGLHGAVSEEHQRILKLTLNNVDRLTHIIGNLLEVSRMEAGELALKLDSFDLVGSVKGLVIGFASKINEKNLELKLNSNTEKLVIFSDEEKILEIIKNLVNNAIRFTEAGYLGVYIEDKDDSVEISVADTGIGISEANQKELFGKFVQFDRTSGPGDRGVGLGLSIVNHLIELLGGKIRVESELGKGSTFTVVIPKNLKTSL